MAYNVYSYHKFGDHVVSYGIIKEFAKHHDVIHYWSDYQTDEMFETNKRLYKDIPNVELIRTPYHEPTLKAEHCIANTKMWFDAMRPWIEDKTGTLPLPEWFNESWIFDRQWYFNAGLPIEKKWENFTFERDFKKEREVFYDVLNLQDGEEFVFLHEDKARDYIIDRCMIDTKNVRVINFNDHPEINILDILYTVEKAKEVHVFNTGLLSFIDLMNIRHINLNYHQYIRSTEWDQPKLHLDWNVII